MSHHIIVVDRRSEFPWTEADRLIVPAQQFVTDAGRRLPVAARVVNLCRDYSYLSLGYYCSLLAEARGQRVIPSVESMLDLHWKRLLRIALPEVNELVRKTVRGVTSAEGSFQAQIFFGVANDPRLNVAARRIFELFRCPILTVQLRYKHGWQVENIEPTALRDVKPVQHPTFIEALDRYTRSAWPKQRATTAARYAVAVLHDPKEALPPSNPKALEKFVRAGQHLGIDVELITRADYGRLSEFDALLIRETTALNHHTYRFAKKAESEGMPVIDDPSSILKCTNKIYLAELLQANDVPMPRTLILDRRRIGRIEREIGYPVVLKIPDGAFSRGVYKASSAAELAVLVEQVFKDTDLVIAQEFMHTAFDWRVGVIDRKPLFVCQYFMARNHWQIVNHQVTGAPQEGRSVTLPVDQAPPRVIEIATRAASLIGNGLYGVDLKETSDGVFVIEINDNPSIDSGVEDGILKEDLYRIIVGELVRRIERGMTPGTPRNHGFGGITGPSPTTRPPEPHAPRSWAETTPLA